MNPVEQAFPPPDELRSPPPEREQLREAIAENRRLQAELVLANQRIVALEARIADLRTYANDIRRYQP
jgi:hypothetical protein